MNSKPRFDSGERSITCGLPREIEMFNYMRFLLESNPTRIFTRHEIEESIAQEFSIPISLMEAEGPGSKTPIFHTEISYLISDAIGGNRKTATPFLKRVGLAEYQHISGPAKALKCIPNVSKRLVNEAMVSVKMLKDLGWEPERIMLELHQWSDDVVEAAIEKVFA